MHIAYFTNSYLPVVNGVVRSVSAYRKALTELGHNVFVFAQDDDIQDQEPFIFRYPSFPAPIDVDIPAVIPFSPFIDRLIPSLKPDLIHAHHPVLLGQAAANKAEELDLPLVFTFHTQYREYTHYVPLPQETVQEFIKNTIHNWMRDYMQRCTRVVIPSESMREILTREYGLESRYSVIPTGIEVEDFRAADGSAIRSRYGWENDRVMISTGRLAKEKNWKTLLEATALALENHPNLRLVILGDGPERQTLEEFSRRLGIGARVQLLGFIPFEEVPSHLKAADLFCFASTTETQGIVTMEALAAGLPVAAVDASGTRDIIQDGKQGLLVEDHSEALAAAIHQLLGDQALYQRLRDAAYERAKKFDMKRLAGRLLDVYEQAIQDKKEGRYVQVKRLG
jgi:glycosyltransferase involved in cell wall biosynthesis